MLKKILTLMSTSTFGIGFISSTVSCELLFPNNLPSLYGIGASYDRENFRFTLLDATTNLDDEQDFELWFNIQISNVKKPYIFSYNDYYIEIDQSKWYANKTRTVEINKKEIEGIEVESFKIIFSEISSESKTRLSIFSFYFQNNEFILWNMYNRGIKNI